MQAIASQNFCSATTKQIIQLQGRLACEDQKRTSVLAQAQAKMTKITKLDNEEYFGKSTLQKLEGAANTLTNSCDVLGAV